MPDETELFRILDELRALPVETEWLEFKEAKLQFDNRKLYEYCVALANEGGGHLLLGVADKPPRPVVGTAAFNDPVAMAEKLFEAVGFRVDIEAVAHPAGRVLVFDGFLKVYAEIDEEKDKKGEEDKHPD